MRSLWTATAALIAAMAVMPAAAAGQLEEGNIVVADPNAFGGEGGLIAVNPQTGAQSILSNAQTSVQDLYRDPTGVAFSPDGSFIVADPAAFGGSGGLIRVDPNTGQQAPLSSNEISSVDLFEDPVGVAVAPSGALMVADAGAAGGGGAVIAVDPTSGQQALVSSNAISALDYFVDPFGIAVERSGAVLIADPETPAPVSGTEGAIVAVDPLNGAQRLVTSNDGSQSDLFSDPRGIAIETPGTLLTANTAADPMATGVVLVSRFSGQQYGLATDGNFTQPTGITMDLDGRALVADAAAFGGNGGLIRVDTVTGGMTTVTGASPGGLFVDPSGVSVVPPTCQGRYATISGTASADALTGTTGPDVIAGRGGDDIVNGEGGADLICGEEGRDRLIGEDGRDRVVGGDGGDVVLGKNGRDFVQGERGNDKIDGGRGNDRIFGQQRRDNLVGGKGRDRLSGGPARDKLTGGPGRDRLRGGPGRDKQKQ
jgi:Ca2+-binding RTX toxin-like protein